MNFSYRSRRFFRRFLTVVLWILLIALLLGICWTIWLQRYVVFTREGVKLDLSRSTASISGQEARPPQKRPPVSVFYDDEAESVVTEKELTQILGYCASTDALLSDINSVRQQIDQLPPGSAVMIDVKSIYGNFFYSTGISGASVTDDLSIAAVDQIITALRQKDLYAIARLPAFRDKDYGLNHVSSGLPVDGIGLWQDEDSCYWLDPADSGTMSYLIQIINELRGLGFDEVVFTEFRFPDSDGEIVYESELTEDEIISKAASDLVTACSNGSFAISFQADTDFPLPQGRSRLYLEDIEASQAAAVAASVKVTDPVINLVFLATSNDTRYNAYSALREIDVGQTS